MKVFDVLIFGEPLKVENPSVPDQASWFNPEGAAFKHLVWGRTELTISFNVWGRGLNDVLIFRLKRDFVDGGWIFLGEEWHGGMIGADQVFLKLLRMVQNENEHWFEVAPAAQPALF